MKSEFKNHDRLENWRTGACTLLLSVARRATYCFWSVVLTLWFVPTVPAATTSYHIGNSLTWDSQPLGIAAIANQHGFDHEVGHHIRCAWSLNGILSEPLNTCVEPITEFGTFGAALPGHGWNAVTMQPHPSAIFNSTLATDVASILAFIGTAQQNGANADTTFYIYSAWPKALQWSDWTSTVIDDDATATIYAGDYFDILINRVRSATSASVNLIPVGEVLYELDQRMQAGQVPGFTVISQFYRDTTHLTLDVGRYTAGVTAFATLFDTDPTGSAKPAGFYGNATAFSPDLYNAIHSAVWDVVSTNLYSGPLYWPADFQFDGFVDGADLAILEAAFGNGAVGDTDGDGDTDGLDFFRWQKKFDGPSVSAAASIAAVPEPTVSSMLFVALVGLLAVTGRVSRLSVACSAEA